MVLNLSTFETTLLVLVCVQLLSLIWLASRINQLHKANFNQEFSQHQERLRQEILVELRESRKELQVNLHDYLSNLSEMTQKQLASGNDQLTVRQNDLLSRLQNNQQQNDHNLTQIRTVIETRLDSMQRDNSEKLEQMRITVDEKLQHTLEERLGHSFLLVNESLARVQEGLGDMKSLASGVGDLKKVLSNVKTRGILGEVQLGAILEQILAPNQYCQNAKPNPQKNTFVEYAIILPGEDVEPLLLPIDAKFPGDSYSALVDAYESEDAAIISTAASNLDRAIKNAAKDISDKYIEPPYTTDFAIMFLPFEGLYAEVVRRGLFETVQREYKITIAGPTTLTAILTSLQMGFRTLAIQKRSSEVWQILSEVKKEFGTFNSVLIKTQKSLNSANTELDALIGTRSRAIERRLKNISESASEEKTEPE